jgi:hypothetical protein
MVQITIFVTAFAAVMSGTAMADNCLHGLDYCGYNLLGKGKLNIPNIRVALFPACYGIVDAKASRSGNYYQDISNSLKRAGQSLTDDHVKNSVFHCGGDDDIPFQKFCGNGKCKDGGSRKDDYCE